MLDGILNEDYFYEEDISQDKSNNMDNLYEKILINHRLSEDILVYINDVREILDNSNQKKIEQYIEYFKDYQNNQKFIENQFNDSIKLIETFNLIQKNVNVIDNIYNMLSDSDLSPENISSMWSGTKRNELENVLKTIILKLKKHISVSKEYYPKLIRSFGNTLLKFDNIENNIKLLRKDKLSIQLYVYVIKMYLFNNNKTSVNVKMNDKFITMIEDYKDDIFNNNNKKFKHKSNPHLLRYGVKPVTNCMKLNELTEIIFERVIKTDNFDKIANANKCTIIVIIKIVKNPVEYDISKLLNDDPSNMTNINPSSGIDKNIVDKFNVVKINSQDPHKYHFDIEIYGSDTYDKTVILETLDGSTYRLMETVSSNHTNILKKNIKYQNTFRINNYNNIVINKALNNMFNEKPFNIEYAEETSNQTDMQIIRNTIYIKLYSLIEEIIVKDYNNGDNIKSLDDINDIIHNSKISETFFNALTELYMAVFGSETEHEELLSTYLSELNNLSVKFERDIHKSYLDKKPSKSLIGDLFNIKRYFEKILIQVLEDDLNDKYNLYSVVNMKSKILKI